MYIVHTIPSFVKIMGVSVTTSHGFLAIIRGNGVQLQEVLVEDSDGQGSWGGLNSFMARFENLNPYHWPGWSVTALSCVLGVMMFFFFTETRSLKCAKVKAVRCSCFTGLKLSAQLKSQWKIRFLVSLHYHSCANSIHFLQNNGSAQQCNINVTNLNLADSPICSWLVVLI